MQPIEIEYATAVVSGLAVDVFGAEKRRGPVVLVTHGRGGSAKDINDYCRDLASVGLVAVAIDQRNHGRRLVDADANAGWGPTSPADMYSNFIGTALDMSLLIDMLPARLGLDTSRTGVTGISLGGHAALAAMVCDERIACCAALIGSGDYRCMMELRAKANDVPDDDFERYYTPALHRAVERYDPIQNPERLADRPILMVNGDVDPLVQAECNRRLESVLRPVYTKSERLKLSVHEGVAHSVTPSMWREARDWFARWLIDDPAVRNSG